MRKEYIKDWRPSKCGYGEEWRKSVMEFWKEEAQRQEEWCHPTLEPALKAENQKRESCLLT